uniref:Pheromone binding protein 10 n=1 Tax=Cyrtotrachelus buqueti TaxID=1892066 RepID=A0A1L3KPR4_9CUCU|nr:pheromone binding protein 10 [Cyrtotrachelus buqueti]
MKVLCLALFLLAAIVLGDEVQDRYDNVHKGCQKDPALYVDDAIFAKLKRGEKVNNLPANFGAHAFCMLKNLDLQDSQGKIQQAAVQKAVERSEADQVKAKRITAECSALNKGTKEDSALALFDCLGKNRINIGQL